MKLANLKACILKISEIISITGGNLFFLRRKKMIPNIEKKDLIPYAIRNDLLAWIMDFSKSVSSLLSEFKGGFL